MATFDTLPSGKTRVRIRRAGVRLTESFTLKGDAQRWAREMEVAIDRGEYFAGREQANKMTIKEALEIYIETEIRRKKGRAQELVRARAWQRSEIAGLTLAQVRGRHCAAIRDRRVKEGVTGTTIRLDFAILRHLYTVARKEWGLEGLHNPVSDIRLPAPSKPRDRRLRPGEENKLLKACNSVWDAAAIMLAIETGMRAGELRKLHRDNIDLNRQVATIPDTKNGEDREVPLSIRAVAALTALPERKDGFIFPSDWTTEMMSRRFARVKKRAKVTGLVFHDLRHEAVSRFFEKGFSIMEVSAISGHKSLSMLKRYTNLRAEDLARKLVEKEQADSQASSDPDI